MKKLLLNFFVVIALILFGAKNANAAVVLGPSTALSSPVTLSGPQTGVYIMGFSCTSGNATNKYVSLFELYGNGISGGTSPDTYFNNTTYTLWRNTTDATTGANFQQITATFGWDGTELQISGLNELQTNTQTYYYFVKANYLGTATAAATYQLTTEDTYSYNNTGHTTGGGYSTTITSNKGPVFNITVPFAATLTSLSTAAGNNGLSSTPVAASAVNYGVYGFSLIGTGTNAASTTINSLTFTRNGTSTDFNSTYYTTAYLYSSTSATYVPGTTNVPGNLVSSIAAAGNTTITFPSTNITVTNTSTKYYFIVLDNSLANSNAATFRLTYTSATFTGTNVTAGATINGPAYTFAAVIPFAATLTSLTTNPGNNGLSATPITYGSANFGVYGFSLIGTGTNTATTTINSLTFTRNGTSTDFDNTYYTTATLYSSTTATYVAGTTNVPGNMVSSATSDGTGTITFPSTNITVTNTSTKYYFIVLSNTLGNGNASTFRLVYTSATYTGTNITAGATVNGPAYTFSPTPPFVATITSLTTTTGNNGLATSPIAYGSTNYSVYGFSVIGSGVVAGSTNINSLTFTQNGSSTNADNTFYTTAYIYSSTTNTFVPGTTNAPANLVSTATSDGTTTITFPSTNISVSNGTTMYYFIVLNNTLGNSASGTFRLKYSANTSTGTTPTTGATVNGPTYNFSPVPPFVATITSLTTTPGNNGLSTTPISGTAANFAVAGFSIIGSGVAAGTTNITSLAFYQNGTSFSYDNTYYNTAYLYSSTTPSFVSGVTNVPANLVSQVASDASYDIVFPATNITVSNGTTMYYFVVLSNNAGNTNSSTFDIAYNSETYTGTALTSGAGTTGPDYTFSASPAIIAADITAGLSPVPGSAIFQGQSNLALAGISLQTASSSTSLAQLVFTLSPSATTANNYFANTPQLFSSSSSTFSTSTATAISTAVATIGASTITFNIPTATSPVTINTTPTYYYLVLNYNKPGTVPQTFTFTPTSYNTGFSGPVTTGYPANSYTCAPNVYVSTASTANFPPTTLANSQTGIPILGFSVASNTTNTFTTFNFTTTESAGSVGTYFYNVRLYSSTTNDFSTAAPVAAGYTVSALTGANFNISGLSQTITTSTVFYFLVVDYTAPNPGPQTFTPTLASVVTSTPTTYSTATNGLPITGPTYTMKTITSYTYYWYGNGATTDWRNPANWITNTTNKTNAGAYPGVFATDNANFNDSYYYSGGYYAYPSIGSYGITIADLYIVDDTYTNLTVNTGYTLTTNTFEIGDNTNSDITRLLVAGTASTSTIPSLLVKGASTLGLYSYLSLTTNGIVNFPSTASITLNGTNANPAYFTNGGGVLNIVSAPISMAGTGSYFTTFSGTTNITTTTLSMSGNSTAIQSTGGTTNLNGCAVNLTGANTGEQITVSGGVFNALPYVSGGTTTNTVINLGTSSANGASSRILVSAGTFNLGAGSTINFNGTTATKFTNSGSGIVNCASTSVINLISAASALTNSSSNAFTLQSDLNGSATLGPVTAGATVTGTFAVQRYLSGGSTTYRGYRLLSSPVNAGSSKININYLKNSCFVTGTTGSSGGFDVGVVNNPTIYLFRENLVPDNTTFTGGNYRGFNNINSAPTYSFDNEAASYSVPLANGYLFFFRGDRNSGVPLSSENSSYAPTPTTLTATGSLTYGAVTFNTWYPPAGTGLIYTNVSNTTGITGFNLTGNPYASSIDWDKSTSNSGTGIQTANVGPFIYILDPVSKNYNVYKAGQGGVGNIASSNSNIISSGQGFFVVASGSGATLKFNETAKSNTQVSTASGNLFMGTPPVLAAIPSMHMTMTKDSITEDGIFINFNNNAKAQYVLNEDAPHKVGFGVSSLASRSTDNVTLAYNTLPFPKQGQVIPLSVGAASDGIYRFNMKAIANIPAIYEIWLKDAYAKDSLDIRNNPNYAFNVVRADTASYGDNRFSLVIRQNPALALHLLSFTGTKITLGNQVTWSVENEQNYTNFTVERSIDNGATYQVLGGMVSDAQGTYSFNDKSPSIATNNMYKLKLEDLNGAISYSGVVIIGYANLANSHTGINVYPNPTASLINMTVVDDNGTTGQTLDTSATNSAAYSIKIVNVDGAVVETAKSATTNWQANVSKLTPGSYIIQVTNTNTNKIVGKSTFIKL